MIPDDPVELELAASLSRPGGNLTGVNFLLGELVPKRLELLHELVPAITRVAALVNPANLARAQSQVRETQSAARAMGLGIQIFNAGTGREINAVFATLARERPDALFVNPDPSFTSTACSLPLWRRDMRSPRHFRRVKQSKLVA